MSEITPQKACTKCELCSNNKDPDVIMICEGTCSKCSGTGVRGGGREFHHHHDHDSGYCDKPSTRPGTNNVGCSCDMNCEICGDQHKKRTTDYILEE